MVKASDSINYKSENIYYPKCQLSFESRKTKLVLIEKQIVGENGVKWQRN